MERSSDPPQAPSGLRASGRSAGGAPVYTYERRPSLPPVGVVRFPLIDVPPEGIPRDHAHAHDFLVLVYVERGGGSLRVDGREWTVAAGDAVVIAPGEVVGRGIRDGLEQAVGWGVFFPADVLGAEPAAASLAWRAHPLLYPFVGRAAGGAQRLRVPADGRPAWSRRLAELERELRERRDGSAEAALAHLTLLLVDLARLAADVVGDLRLRDEPVLAGVFEFVEAHYGEPISLADVARALGRSPGHLTTVVRRKTGRTVQGWIAERRMVEARRLLAETELTVEAIGARVGYDDPSYFIKRFRRAHAVTPLQWRRGA